MKMTIDSIARRMGRSPASLLVLVRAKRIKPRDGLYDLFQVREKCGDLFTALDICIHFGLTESANSVTKQLLLHDVPSVKYYNRSFYKKSDVEKLFVVKTVESECMAYEKSRAFQIAKKINKEFSYESGWLPTPAEVCRRFNCSKFTAGWALKESRFAGLVQHLL